MTGRGGVWFGLAAALAWGVYNVGVGIGRSDGFSTSELTLLRYLGGAIVMVPLMILLKKRPMQGLTWLRLAVLVCVAGPPFAWFFTTGFALAPLSHAVVISPGMTMVMASLLSRFVDGQRQTARHLVGMGMLLIGLLFIAADRSEGPDEMQGAAYWLGDLCFVVSGSCWGVFTWLMSRWKLDPIATTGAIAIGSSIVFLPIYLLLAAPTIAAPSLWAIQFIYQGALGGALAIVWYNAAIQRMGPAAGVFPALVPPLAILIAIPMTGSLPNLLQLAGIAMASLGLLASLNLSGWLRRRGARGQDRETALR